MALTHVQGIYAYCTLNDGVEYTDGLKKELVMAVREQIGAFAAPDVIHWAPGASSLQACQPDDVVPQSCGEAGCCTSLTLHISLWVLPFIHLAVERLYRRLIH